jgi:intracellular multiplication protein IcmL
MAEDNAIALVFKRNQFYRRQYFLVLGAFVLSLLVIGALIGVLVFLKRNPTQPLYFATDKVSRLIQVIPVDRPNMTNDDVIAWVKEAVEATYSYDYVNYHSQFQDAQKYFTNYGWIKYLGALKASNNVVALTERKMIVIAQSVEQPRILTQGILGGAYAWKFEVPLLVTYWLPPYDEKSKFVNPLVVSIIVQRQPILQSYQGLGIVQIIGAMASSESKQLQEISDTPSG